MSEENKQADPAKPERPIEAPGQRVGENPPNPDRPAAPAGTPGTPGTPPVQPSEPPKGAEPKGEPSPAPAALGPGQGKEKAKKKKRAVLFLVVIGLLLGLLALLNLVDFDAISQKIRENADKTPKQTVQTYPVEWFDPPDYSDPAADADYMELNRNMEYTEGSESFSIVGNPAAHGDLCVFWQAYLDALVAGDAETLKSLHTDRYFELMEENGEYLGGFENGFAPQKVYNFKVRLLETLDLGESGDVNGNYKGYTVHYFTVSYQIKDNNGTFRRDMDADGNAVPLEFEVLELGDLIQINTQSRNWTVRVQTEKGVNIMMFIWIALILFAIVAELMTTALVAVWFIPSGIVSLVLSIIWPEQIVAQIVTYVAVSALLLILTRPLIKRHLRKRPFQPTNADMVVGKIAIVTEAIDNVAQTGEVRVAGKRWTARSADGNPIAVDTLVSVLEIQGVKLICAPAPKGAKFE